MKRPKKGFHLSEEHKRKIGLANSNPTESQREQMKLNLQKLIAFNRTKKGREENSKRKKGKRTGKENNMWKGDEVGYIALHLWIKGKLGKANHCENIDCFYPRTDIKGRTLLEPKKFHWANVSGEYKRDISDWRQLCSSCNHKDGIKKHPRFKRMRREVNQI